ncbi:MAG: hypothetical protein NT076_01775 [Candidatus Pacearchaeota archaeon]|nr:hypothetical protein [Candidatus Pacearchaeota archaeon]
MIKPKNSSQRFGILGPRKSECKRGFSLRGKKADLNISFGMIFSIILIIAFVGVAFYAIRGFLSTKNCAELGQFKQDLQDSIDKAWGSDESSFVFSRTIGAEACIINISASQIGANEEQYNSFKKLGYQGNLFFYPLSRCKGSVFILNHINLDKITSKENPYCLPKKVELKIVKNFNDPRVCVGDDC